MAWIITQNKLDSEDCDIRSMGDIYSWSDDGTKRMFKNGKALKTFKFRLLDDDGEIYYIGYSTNSSSFAPLDNFGMPNDGCTDIQYLVDGQWESL